MWMITTTGFFSVVKARRKCKVTIRARERQDLVRLLKRMQSKAHIVDTPEADYPHRIVVETKTWKSWAARLAADAETYPNFKTAVGLKDTRRAEIYHRLWIDLLAIEEDRWTLRAVSRGR